MVTWLRDRLKVRSNISVLVADPPSWLSRCGELWAATAFAAEAFGLNGDAIAAFIQASELLPDFRSEALARAGLAAARADDQDRARSLLQRASAGASDTEALFVDVVTSAIAEDAEALEGRAQPGNPRRCPHDDDSHMAG